jgi:hypothetical protein
MDEGLPFSSRAEADAFIEKHPVRDELPPMAPRGKRSSGERGPERKLQWTRRAEQRREAAGRAVRHYIRHPHAI